MFHSQFVMCSLSFILDVKHSVGVKINTLTILAYIYIYKITSRQQKIVQNQNIVIGNISFENVEKFRYLGVTVTNTNDMREEIKRIVCFPRN